MTSQVIAFVAQLGSDGKVLEVGSRDINGSLRNFYKDYIGVDMRPGKGVDIVAYAQALPFESKVFDKVLCLEMLEHDLRFWESLREMIRVLKPGGMLILTARGIGFPKHDFPSDYYRFTAESFKGLFDMFGSV